MDAVEGTCCASRRACSACSQLKLTGSFSKAMLCHTCTGQSAKLISCCRAGERLRH